MAEGHSILKRLQSEVTCPLCLDIFTEPKKLPCDHVYCRACLHGLALRNIDGTISCPECRMSVTIPRLAMVLLTSQLSSPSQQTSGDLPEQS